MGWPATKENGKTEPKSFPHTRIQEPSAWSSVWRDPHLRGLRLIGTLVPGQFAPNATLEPSQFQGNCRRAMSISGPNHDDVPLAYGKLFVFQGSSSSFVLGSIVSNRGRALDLFMHFILESASVENGCSPPPSFLSHAPRFGSVQGSVARFRQTAAPAENTTQPGRSPHA